ncbi:phosphoenolpyruvate--protein phosphotransferase [Ancylobacter sp. Lp-2]|nr:putative PEP-binding protein [Ancylobacter sp. Lp-2]MCB4771657.1 phosphoenolpyruvate--protein phosphotransferase [Ancylobacter sp. Lp-2]
MAGPRELTGKAASPGRACGPAFRALAPAAPPAMAGEDARAALAGAVTVAIGELRALAAGADAESAGVLDFQIEMLLDDDLIEPALARIARGEGAALAWAGAMDAHIAALVADDGHDAADTIGARGAGEDAFADGVGERGSGEDAFADGVGERGAGEDAFAARAADLADLRQRVLDALAGRPRADFPAAAIYVGDDMPPSLFLAHDWSKGGGIALGAGSTVSHVAMLARARGVPMVIGLGPLAVVAGQPLLVDGTAGRVGLDPAEPVAPPLPTIIPAAVAGPGGAFRLSVNLNSLSDLAAVDPATVDGVGLVRSEFLFLSPAEALSEERHVDCYRAILARFSGRPVRLRLLDLGGDKALPGLVEGGPASLLGERGIRFLLAHPDLARIQARAILRAAADSPATRDSVSVLLPMVTLPQEVAAMAALFDEEAARLARLGIAARRPPLGIMVEVPAAALTLDLFEAAAFFSVGTNDLMQYLSAAARDNPIAAPLNAGSETALFRLMAQIATTAEALGKPVSVCGDLAGDPEALARLVGLGFRDFSVAPSRLAAIGPLRRAMPAGEG